MLANVQSVEQQSPTGNRAMINPGTLLQTLAQVIRDNADELTDLDQAIGDGDHGVNMRRGFDAVAEMADELNALDPGSALQKAGMTLVMKVGGASGPLYGSLLMTGGKSLGSDPGVNDMAAALRSGIDAVCRRGKAEPGDKTMLDVLLPVSKTLEACVANGDDPAVTLAAVRQAGSQGLESTRDMLARKGRASFLGERSIGHLDPGARSAQLIIEAVCQALGAKP